jgi:hypothetical protein
LSLLFVVVVVCCCHCGEVHHGIGTSIFGEKRPILCVTEKKKSNPHMYRFVDSPN